MKYGLLMYSDPAETGAMPAADRDAVGSLHQSLRSELLASGELVGGAAVEVRQVHDSLDTQELTRGR